MVDGHASRRRGFLGRVVRDGTSGNPARFSHLSLIYLFCGQGFQGTEKYYISNRRARGPGGTAKIFFFFELSPYPPHLQRSGVKRDERKVCQ